MDTALLTYATRHRGRKLVAGAGVEPARPFTQAKASD